MSDNMMPELTLNPTEAAQEAVPELTLTSDAPAPEQEKKKEVEPVKVDESMLTEQEKKAVDEFVKKIDITDTNLVLNYGVAAQKSVATFSENALSSVRNKDLGEVGETLSNLVVEVKGFGQEEEKKGLAGLFRKQKDKLELMRAQYGKAETSVNRIVSELEKHQVTLMKDIAMLDQMYELNLKYYKELTMYIIAGKKRLAEVRSGELEELRKKAEASGLAEDAQAYNDYAQKCERFEKKLHDLELTRMVSLQMGPQTRLLQNNDTLMVEKIQSSLVNTIPLWKSPDGARARHGAQPSGHGRTERGGADDERASQEERRHAQDGHHRHGKGSRAQHRRYRDAAAHERAARLHARRGREHPARGRAEAQGSGGRARPHRR